MLAKTVFSVFAIFAASVVALPQGAPPAPQGGAPSIKGPIGELAPALGPGSIGKSVKNSFGVKTDSKANGNPAGNGIANGDTTDAEDSVINNAKILNGAGIANGAINGNSLLNGNEIDPNILAAGSGNDGNAIDVNDKDHEAHPEGDFGPA